MIARVAAVVGPLVVSVALAALLASPVAPGGDDLPVTGMLDWKMKREPEVLVLGNSSGRRAIDLDVVRSELVEDRKAVFGTSPASSPATWYALLKYRVYAKGYRPDLVILPAMPWTFWVTEPVVGADIAALVQVAGSEDPVVRASLGSDGMPVLLHRIGVRKRLFRAAFFEGVAAGVKQLVGMGDRPEVEAFFAQGKKMTGAHAQVFDAAGLGEEEEYAPDVESTFIPELVELVEAHGGRLVLASIPPRDRADSRFLLDRPSSEAELAAWFEGRRSRYLQLSGVEVPPAAYEDAWHMRRRGARIYTAALLEALD